MLRREQDHASKIAQIGQELLSDSKTTLLFRPQLRLLTQFAVQLQNAGNSHQSRLGCVESETVELWKASKRFTPSTTVLHSGSPECIALFGIYQCLRAMPNWSIVGAVLVEIVDRMKGEDLESRYTEIHDRWDLILGEILSRDTRKRMGLKVSEEDTVADGVKSRKSKKRKGSAAAASDHGSDSDFHAKGNSKRKAKEKRSSPRKATPPKKGVDTAREETCTARWRQFLARSASPVASVSHDEVNGIFAGILADWDSVLIATEDEKNFDSGEDEEEDKETKQQQWKDGLASIGQQIRAKSLALCEKGSFELSFVSAWCNMLQILVDSEDNKVEQDFDNPVPNRIRHAAFSLIHSPERSYFILRKKAAQCMLKCWSYVLETAVERGMTDDFAVHLIPSLHHLLEGNIVKSIDMLDGCWRDVFEDADPWRGLPEWRAASRVISNVAD